jgi:hypothetical protein
MHQRNMYSVFCYTETYNYVHNFSIIRSGFTWGWSLGQINDRADGVRLDRSAKIRATWCIEAGYLCMKFIYFKRLHKQVNYFNLMSLCISYWATGKPVFYTIETTLNLCVLIYGMNSLSVFRAARSPLILLLYGKRIWVNYIHVVRLYLHFLKKYLIRYNTYSINKI